MGKPKVILDVDTGTDDAVAILCAALSDKIELIGLTVAAGNQPLHNTIENTLRMVDFLGMDIPVYGGCPEAMVRTLMPGRQQDVRVQTVAKKHEGEQVSIHQEYLPLPPSTTQVQKKHACQYLIDTLKESDEKITIIAVAPLTNIAMALRLDPTIAGHIEKIVIMGGSVTSGNRTPVAEANFYDDPEAAQIVLKAGCPVEIFTMEATEYGETSSDDLKDLRGRSKFGEFVADQNDDFIRRCSILGIAPNNAATIHDAVTVCGVIDPSMVLRKEKRDCDIQLGGWSDGQLVVDQRSFAESPKSNVTIVYELDKAKYIDIMRDCFTL